MPRKRSNVVAPAVVLASALGTRIILKLKDSDSKECGANPSHHHRHLLQRLSALPKVPDVSMVEAAVDKSADYAILVSMYEVYNDRIFDLLAGQQTTQKDLRRRPLLFKSTEHSPDKKVVAGLRKVVCGNVDEAMMVLEAGLMERRVAGTGSNSVSSRSHGFFCIEIKKKSRHPASQWTQSTLTIVDLAGKWQSPCHLWSDTYIHRR